METHKGENKMKKKNLVVKLAILGIGASLLGACSNNGSDTKEARKDRFFGLEAMTALAKASSYTPSSSLLKAFSLYQASNDPHIDAIQALLPELDVLLENGFETSSIKKEGTFNIDGEQYTYQEAFSFKDIKGNDVSYSLFYNEVGMKEEIEEDEREIETFYKGVAALDEETFYPFQSKYETEEERNEKEESMEFTIWTAKSSYLSIETSFEEEGTEIETEFEYKVVENGRTITDYSIEIEKEGEREKIEFEQNDIEYQLMKVYSEERKEYLYQATIEGEDEEDKKYLFEKTILDGKTEYVLLP